MEELFRLKIEDGRKTTLPQHLLNLLQLRRGDELRIVMNDNKVLRIESHVNTKPLEKRKKEEIAEDQRRISAMRAGKHDDTKRLEKELEIDLVAYGASI